MIKYIMFLNILLISSLFFISSCKEYKAVDYLDVDKYVGKWFQVYKDNFNGLFQGKGTCSTAEYHTIDNSKISVFNKQLNKNNEYDSIKGYAYYKNDDCCGYLTVSLDGNPEAPYWVIELGPEVDNSYDYSIISDDKQLSLFVLTRNVERFYKNYDEQVLSSLNEFGFNKIYNNPTTMNQTNCN